ncbi:putative PAS/PAC sensor protein [Pedosphaera parvula Ellin514]|uniref:histidine kinase n=2 Tax=Pedosphaera TaxID=1032526 RepID=B9XGF2_PEDPL|nr:putative PAS/PAC sensor protein [Pedosphaera parvula Ellin514]
MLSKNAQMSLSEERYQSLGIATGQIVWVMDALGNMTDDQSNTTWRTFTGQTREEARGFGWMNALHPDDRERVARIYAQAIKTRSVYDAEYRLRRHDGKYRSVCARGVPVLTEDGKISEWVGSCLDITERKRVEEELHYKTAFLEAQVHHSIDGILVVNSQGKKILQNQRISDMWEIPQSIADDPDDKVQIRFVMNQVRYPEQFVEKVNYLYSHPNEVSRDEIELKNGKVFDRYSSPVIDRNGKHYGRIWTFRDVTERRRAEEALRESRQELNEAQRLARVGSWVWEPETDVVTWSEELYRMVGRDPASPAPSFREQSRQFTAESWKRLTAVAERALQSGAAYELELEMIRSDNQRIWVIARGEAQRDVNGTIVRLRGTVQDITERKRVDEALRKAHGEMEQRVEERTHELKIANEQLKQTNRLFHILSECNQHVVRAVSEADLMFGICRIIVDIGGYPSVWIGFAEDDHGKTVRPVAQRGFEDGYLNTLRVTWADTEMGWGPAATAIRSGQPHIVEDIQTSVRFAPWRADAMRRGYASAIGLPLAGNGRVFGALVIYAMTPDAFHAREVGVLMELASDLAYGIMAMRGREERRQAEEQVRRLAELQSAILNNTTYTVISTNAQGIITSINPAGERALGYSAEECVGKVTPTVFHHPDEMAERARIFSAELGIPIEPGFEVFVARARRNLPNEYEWLYRRKDGSSFPVLLSVTALRDSQGSIMGFLGLANDITERKRAEEALRESRQELSEAQRIAKVGNWTWDPETDRVTWSEELYRISGLDPAMPTPSYRELQRHYTPQGWERLNAAVEQALQRGTPYELDLEFIRDNGERGWIIARGEAQRDATGRIVKLRGTAQDITDRKRGEEALSESRHELTEAQRIAKVGNWSWDPELDVVTWSEELCRINGRDPASSPPKFSELQTVYTAESLQRLRPFVERALQTGMPYELELEMIRADGGRAWVTTRGEAQRAPDGRIVKLRGTVQDNTERKQAEEALYRSEQKFETIFRGSPVALCVSELETGRLIEINEALLRLMHGTSFDQMVGHTSLEIGNDLSGGAAKNAGCLGSHRPMWIASRWLAIVWMVNPCLPRCRCRSMKSMGSTTCW